MNDGEYNVDILDTNGNTVDKKLRKDIKKGVDIYHAVYGVIIAPDNKIVVSVIGNPVGMPNLHAGKMGCTCATIRRTDESAVDAMKRAIKKELKIIANPELIYEEFIDIDNTKRLLGLYVIKSDVPSEYNKEDIEELRPYSFEEFEMLLKQMPQNITPPLKLFWQTFKNKSAN